MQPTRLQPIRALTSATNTYIDNRLQRHKPNKVWADQALEPQVVPVCVPIACQKDPELFVWVIPLGEETSVLGSLGQLREQRTQPQGGGNDKTWNKTSSWQV